MNQYYRCLGSGCVFFAFLFASANLCALEVQITYDGDWGAPDVAEARKTAFEWSVDLWAGQLKGNNPIKVKAIFKDLNISGSASPTEVRFTHGEFPNSYEWKAVPVALNAANTKDASGAGPDKEHPGYHIVINIDSKQEIQGGELISYSWHCDPYTKPKGSIPYPPPPQDPTQLIADGDLISTVLHELCHGLGFANYMLSNGRTCLDCPKSQEFVTEHMYNLGVDDGALQPLLNLNYAERSVAIVNDMIYWTGTHTSQVASGAASQYSAILPGGFIRIFSSSPWEPGSSLSHWDRSLTQKLLMGPSDIQTPSFRRTDWSTHALRDIGWEVKPVSIDPQIVGFLNDQLKELQPSVQNIDIINGSDVEIAVQELMLLGEDEQEFGILEPTQTPILIPVGETYTVEIAFSPTSAGIKQALLRINYSGSEDSVQYVELHGISIGADSDGDGISDFDESRDLDLDVPGIQNPFNPSHPDTTGYNGVSGWDGLIDGLNDWDGDGITNRVEFFQGLNPIQAEVVLPVEITNLSSEELHLTHCDITGPNSSEYSIIVGGKSKIIQPGRVHKVYVSFTPQSSGPKSGSLLVFYEEGQGTAGVAIPISGNGV